MNVSENNIVFLLGAGASVDAAIPSSENMVKDLERRIVEEDDWKPLYELYCFLKSSINYSSGLQGNFNEVFNIEQLLGVMDELNKRDKNTIYPFIGTWNIHLLEVAGDKFIKIAELKDKIEKLLVVEWVKLKNKKTASYYGGFAKLQKEIGHSIRVFSLNYDLCFENTIGKTNIHLGFGENDVWNYLSFTPSEEAKRPFYLYKLHGSLDWYNEENDLKICDDSAAKPELIFGLGAKLRAHDPYLFYMQEFRRYLYGEPDCKLMVVIGYSFQDSHINSILKQALINQEKKLYIVTYNPSLKDKKNIYEKLSLNESSTQVFFDPQGASSFLQNSCNVEYLSTFFVQETGLPF